MVNDPSTTHPQPIRNSLRNIISHLIANAETPADKKAMICVAYESRVISCAEAFATIQELGLGDA